MEEVSLYHPGDLENDTVSTKWVKYQK